MEYRIAWRGVYTLAIKGKSLIMKTFCRDINFSSPPKKFYALLYSV